ncbi:Gfo/Idh/MocA family oxidoreductase [Tautonia marina]|uniref:Gfo/Idh/MocA family oxidoreductase n=1 Tax=Tautonia marina TaxID=2653855 RepID=UPI001260E4D2|nr:Gfo/Idh/MocA family oxidoreductase [Tautonia marina]
MTPSNSNPSRRSFLKHTGAAASVSALAGVYVPAVHASEQNTIKVALVGCGGRGTGAAANALSVQNGPIKLVAMADVFEDKLTNSFNYLEDKYSSQMDVPEDRRFLGFDAYKNAIDCLDPGDVVIMTTPPAFRWPHFTYAIEKGVNTFMEKPVTVDGPTTRRMIELGEKAKEKNLKVGVGLMCRHCDARKALYERIKNGEIGDLLTLRSYRQVGGGGLIGPNTSDMTELMYQIRNFHGFMWASGGVIMDYMIHNIDESCWMKDAWPVTAQAQGARLYREDKVDQNFDNYSIEYTFDDGTKLFVYTRNVPRCHQEFASYAHGTKGSAVISTNSHTPAKTRIYADQRIDQGEPVWAFPQPEPNPYQLEWDHLIAAIRNDEPWNEVKRGAEASLVTAMGRMAAHTGRIVTFDEMLNHDHEFAPEVDQLTLDSPAPLQLLASGIYPQPEPGRLRDREF